MTENKTEVISVVEHEKKIKKLEERLKKLEENEQKRPIYSKTWAEVYPDGNYPE